MKTYELKSKVALVTGANRGIGEAYIKALLNAGAKKIYAGVRNLDDTTHLTTLNPEVIKPVLLDVTNSGHLKALTESIPALDILINNAGIVNASNLTSNTTLEITRQEMEANFFGPLQVTLAVLPQLRQSTQAAIINVSSIAGISSFPSITPYSATKAALHSYTQGLRSELGDQGIAVIGVYPGPIDTRMTADWDVDKASPEQVADRTLQALEAGKTEVFPDDFSVQMYELFLEHPKKLEEAFAAMQ